jgi:hypothetical protein
MFRSDSSNGSNARRGVRVTTDKRPPRNVPLLYLVTAHGALALACVLAGLWPRAVGFCYHSWMLAIVHLVTLGWITFSILGAIYIVGPIALGILFVASRILRALPRALFAGHVAGMVRSPAPKPPATPRSRFSMRPAPASHWPSRPAAA